MSKEPVKCGTESGYQRHRRKKEDACEPCLEAIRVLHQERATVRRKAVAELIRRHSVEYGRLRDEVIARRAAERARKDAEWAEVMAEFAEVADE